MTAHIMLEPGWRIVPVDDHFELIAAQPVGVASFDWNRVLTMYTAPTYALCEKAYITLSEAGVVPPSDWEDL
jgi:hypothetical protein